MKTVLDLRFAPWPESPVDAAAEFYRKWAPEIRDHAGMSGVAADIAADTEPPVDAFAGVVLVFAPADFTHDGWRLTAVEQMARECAPMRVNAVVGAEQGAIDQVVDYLAAAPGVTGQVFRTDGNSPANR